MTGTKQNPTVRAEVVSVTPAMAETWLVLNRHNRIIRPGDVDKYARDMAAGAWKLNGEAVKFSRGPNRVILDGQHRLLAIVQSGVTVDILVIEGLEPQTQDTMDSGVKRTAADVLSLSGERNASILAGIARRVFIWERSGHKSVQTTFTPTTNNEVISTLHAFPDIRTAAEFTTSIGRGVEMAPSMLGFCFWVLSRINAAHAATFFEGLATGANLDREDPVLVLRNKLVEARKSQMRTPDHVLISYMFKAWNASRKGQRIRLLRQSPHESFPQPK